jgi:hypothetical protein
MLHPAIIIAVREIFPSMGATTFLTVQGTPHVADRLE